MQQTKANAKPTVIQPNVIRRPQKFDQVEYEELVRYHKKANIPAGMVQLVDLYSRQKKLTASMTSMALKALHNIDGVENMEQVLNFWIASSSSPRDEVVGNATIGLSMIYLFCKTKNVHLAETVSSYLGVSKGHIVEDILASSDLQSLINSLALGHSMAHQFTEALQYLSLLSSLKLQVDHENSKKILKIFLRESNTESVLRCLRFLVDTEGLQDNDSLQLITNSFLRDLTFIKGAVSMSTLPETTLPEVMFIGRSNVGKSSLINMITNRKNLAFTSKTAGKTTEFNYFEATGYIGPTKEKRSFHLVDVPGVGYAEAAKHVKSVWTTFQETYVKERTNLRCIFHLLDSRHGLMDADRECLSLLEKLPSSVDYVIVLTKTDKLKTASLSSKPLVKQEILDRIEVEVTKRTDRRIPLVFSSSESRMGGAELLTIVLEHVYSVNIFPSS
eukprot:gene8131-8971_t